MSGDIKISKFYLAAAVFTSALLLFQVQPLLAKHILPWFGGGAAIWTVSMLSFQLLLLTGYAYAHWLTRLSQLRRQVWIHLGLLGLSLLFLPIIPAKMWQPDAADNPVLRILVLLTATVGLPFLLLASTSPLLQHWLHTSRANHRVYRFYALSNVGSLLGLLIFPFVLEPLAGVRHQSMLWSAGYILFIGLSGWCAWGFYKNNSNVPVSRRDAGGESLPTSMGVRLSWILLAACGSVMLLATTNRMTQDVAPIPLLWVLPLALYLATFIICFENERWYDRRIWAPVLVVCLGMVVVLLFKGVRFDIRIQIAVYMATMFACCMVCHGELVRARPRPDRLTEFYLTIAAGGVLGGILVGVVAPLLLDDLWEYHIGLVATMVFLTTGVALDASRTGNGRRYRWPVTALAVGTAALAGVLVMNVFEKTHNNIAAGRNFYGPLKVYEYNKDTIHWYRFLVHGQSKHAGQLMSPRRRSQPTYYYGPDSGVGLAILAHPTRFKRNEDGAGLRIGAVGLGTGTIAAYGRAQDLYRFYELDPQVVEWAETYFTYLADSKSEIEVILGDARLSMERELEQGDDQRYDVLVLDAFNSDAVPVHLLTREAFEVYWRHLKPDGILAVHISGLHTDLSPVVRGSSRTFDKQVVSVVERGDRKRLISDNEWNLVTSNLTFLNHAAVRRRVRPTNRQVIPVVWTDDYTNLFSVIW